MISAGVDAWLERLDAIDSCPWPGPRPLGRRDSSLLVGRVPVRREFRSLLQTHRLLLLHGPSGVGKSSLLQAGLVADLAAEGYWVRTNDQWGGMPHDEVPDFLATKFRLEGEGEEAFHRLGTTLGEKALLIFDQFEELIRYSPSDAKTVFDLIVRINREYETKIVISFRSEYLHEFSSLEKRVVNFSHTQLSLPELPEGAGERVILAANGGRKADPAEAVISEDVAAEIAAAWEKARSSAADRASGDDPYRRVGLLHLQAFIYAMYFTVDGRKLTREVLREGLARWSDDGLDVPGLLGGGAELPAEGFEFALRQAVDAKLAHCMDAGGVDGEEDMLDPYLSEGTAWMLERVVPHLSSAGYKLIRGARELVRLAMGGDFEALGDAMRISDDHYRALFEVMADTAGIGEGHRGDAEKLGSAPRSDLLAAERVHLARSADELLSEEQSRVFTWSAALAAPGAPAHVSDPTGVTAGPVFGLAPADALVEELRRYLFAVIWLERSSLVRVTTPLGSGAMISLIHDGFGPALARWADQRRLRPDGPLVAITAPRGASFAWSDGPASPGQERPAALGPEGPDHRILANLRWRGGWTMADLDRVIFLNCDLRGTMFSGCRMTGVVFVNCLLDGAMFTECLFEGAQADMLPDSGWSNDEPTFLVPATERLVRSFARYRPLTPSREEPATFLSDLPGAPALPYQGEPSTSTVVFADPERKPEARRLHLELPTGGMAVYGGRVSTLAIRRCRLGPDSGITVRHSTGSGVEFVEMVDSPGRVELFGCAIRHVTFSANPYDDSLAHLDLRARACTLAEVYVGRGIKGSATIRTSTLVHAWNGSPSEDSTPDTGVEFTAEDCTVHGTIDLTLSDNNRTLGSGPQTESLADIDDIGIAGRMDRMDYRRSPASLRDQRIGRHG